MFRQQIRDAREEGFTLIELLIVIVVLGILAGIVVFGVSQFRKDAQASACNADLKIVQVASDAYNAKTDAFALGIGVKGDVAADKTLVGLGYIKDKPVSAVAYDATTGVASATC